MLLPINLDLPQMATRWKAILDPVISNQLNGALLLQDIELISGTTVVSHKLGKKQTGWWIVDQDAAADIYRSAAFNDKTLTLVSNNAVTVKLAVF